jgi:manganese/zinc/iron transport system permease protein
MELAALLSTLLGDYTLRTVALGSAVLGLVSGALGVFAVLRRESLLGDAISHAALPGVVLAFMLTGAREAHVLLMGALIAGWVGTAAVMGITSLTRVKHDAALGIVLAVFFGGGLLLLTFVQRMPDASKAGLDRYLFGQAATLLMSDVLTMGALGAVALTILALLWKEVKLISFDPQFAAGLGLPVRMLDVALVFLTVLAIVIGLQTVGVVLMSAMLVAPASAARQWTQSLGVMVLLAGLFGALAGLLGAVTSSLVPRLPTGPSIVICVSGLVVVSLLFAPERGVIARARQRARQRWQFATEALLVHLLQHEGQPDQAAESEVEHLSTDLRWRRTLRDRIVERTLAQGLVQRTDGHLRLTPEGRKTARRAMVR